MAVLMAGCDLPPPIAVYVTATYFPTTTPTAADSTAIAVFPTNTPLTVEITVTPTPTATFTPMNTQSAPPTDPTPTPSPSAAVTFRGPVVGGDYRPPATSTPLATETSLPTGTPLPGTPTVTAQVTGFPVTLPNLDPVQMGIQLDINLSQDDWFQAMGQIENLGIQWIKVQLAWRDMQPTAREERDNEYFRRVEQYLEDANRRGLSVMISVVKAPGWARSTIAEDGPPNDPADLANFISIILQEISPDAQRDVIGEYIDAVEIWNEPNLIREWQGTIPFNGAGYMQLFAPAYQAVRAYSSTMPIITAGLAPTASGAFSVDDREFLRQMYAAGLSGYNDVVIGVHPYSWGNSPDAACCGNRGWDEDPHFYFADTLREYREIMAANGDADVQMWVTEFGWATWDSVPGDPPADSAWMRFNDRWAQAEYTIRAFQIAQSNGNMGPMMLWNLNFASLAGLIENRDERVGYSIIIPGQSCNLQLGIDNLTERPVYWMIFDAVRPELTLPDHCGVPPRPLTSLGG